jgi:glycerol-3-phosphate dehydrogenase
MIEDANKIPSGSSFAADLCVVGAGAAGISLALQFTATGLDVLLVESGGMKESSATHALYKGEVVNPAWHPPAH